MLRFGLFGRIWVRIGPKRDKALRMGQGGTNGQTDRRTDRRTDSPCVLQDFIPFGAAAQKKREWAEILDEKKRVEKRLNLRLIQT